MNDFSNLTDSFLYVTNGKLISIQYENGHWAKREYDAEGNLVDYEDATTLPDALGPGE